MAFSTEGAMSGAGAGASMGPWGAVAGGVIGGFMGGNSGAEEAQKANAANLAFQQQMYQQQDPFSAGGNRAQYVPQLNALMQGGVGGLVNDPTYMGIQKQGQQAVERSMAARGMGGSGNEMSAILKQHMGLGMDYFNQQYNRLATLSGAMSGRTAPMHGMSPETAYNIGSAQDANRMGSFGQGIGGIASLFGGSSPQGGVLNAGGSGTWSNPGSQQTQMLNEQW